MDLASSSSFKLLPEQDQARELFLKEEGLRIDAYAGTGKTTTLQLLARSTAKRGLYLAFNRSIAKEAQGRFPGTVQCATAHSMAFRQIRRQFDYPDWKLTGVNTPGVVADAFRFPAAISFNCGLVLDRFAYAAVLRDALNQFLRSDGDRPTQDMIPCHGRLELLSSEQFESFGTQAVEHVGVLWKAMQNRTAGPPLGHDGYLKLWAMTKPTTDAEYLMIDEAQDLNPVLLGVLARMAVPLVFAGDPYQQIYEWRGAINAMSKLPSRHKAFLAQSFRFGKEIAAGATIVLKTLGAPKALLGSPAIESHIARVRPNAILARSNAGVITNVIKCLRQDVSCAVLGGVHELARLLSDVQRIKQNAPSQTPELLGYRTWKDVMNSSMQPEGEHLRSLVTLVQEHGENQILRALSRCEKSEQTAQVVCSTAHKAKGREWDYVHLDRDFEIGFSNVAKQLSRSIYEAEARLLYVAITRARKGVRIPRDIAKHFGISKTTDQFLGMGSAKSPEN